MSPPSLCLSDLHAEVLSTQVGCESDPPPPYPDSTVLEAAPEQVQHRVLYPVQSGPDPPVSSTADEEPPLPGLSEMAGPTLALHTLIYVCRSLAKNAWGTRAVEYAIGTGCVVTIASVLLLVKKRRLTAADRHTMPGPRRGRALRRSEWPYAEGEREFVVILTSTLSPGIAGMGYCIRSLVLEGPAEDPAFLVGAFLGGVGALFVVLVTVW